jgi:hypothetical protein
MRFYDDVMRDKDIPRAVKDLLDGAVVVVCDNVAHYYYCDTDKENWDLQDFPNIAPPWGRFWLDFKAPPYIVSEEYGGRIPWGPEKPTMWGLYCQAEELIATSKWCEGGDWQYIGPYNPDEWRPCSHEGKKYIAPSGQACWYCDEHKPDWIVAEAQRQ